MAIERNQLLVAYFLSIIQHSDFEIAKTSSACIEPDSNDLQRDPLEVLATYSCSTLSRAGSCVCSSVKLTKTPCIRNGFVLVRAKRLKRLRPNQSGRAERCTGGGPERPGQIRPNF
jgi:hypothetical protein